MPEIINANWNARYNTLKNLLLVYENQISTNTVENAKVFKNIKYLKAEIALLEKLKRLSQGR